MVEVFVDPGSRKVPSRRLRQGSEIVPGGNTNQEGAFTKFPEFAQTMMTENARTIGEMEARPPIFNENDPRRISAPTLLIKRITDPEFMRETFDLMSEITPHSEVLSIPNSGHFPHTKNAEFY